MKVIAEKTHFANKDYIIYNDIVIDIYITESGSRIFSTIGLTNHNVLGSKTFRYVRQYINNQFALNPLTGSQIKKKYS